MRLALGFDPRARYLTGLGAPDPRRATFHPPAQYAALAARTMPMMSRRRRMALYGYDPRQRYLTGLGDIYSDWLATQQPGQAPPTLPLPFATLPAAPPPAEPGYTVTSPLPSFGPTVIPSPAGTSAVVVPPAGVPVVTAAAQPQPAAGASWWSGTTLGITNWKLAGGLGGVALLALLTSGRRR